MDVNLETLFGNADLYFHAYGPDDQLSFLPMDREHFAKSIFCDQRIEPAVRQIYRVPVDTLMKAYEKRGYLAPQLGYIHHIAQTGSTILSRALDIPGRSLAIREPAHLRQVGLMGGAGFDIAHAPKNFGPMLGFSLSMLGKRYAHAQPIIVKGNVPTSFIAEAINKADPGRPTIFLHYNLEEYLAAVLRTPGHMQWVENVAGELSLAESPHFAELATASTPLKAAGLWLGMMKAFQAVEDANGNSRALDANYLFEARVPTLMAASKLMEMPLETAEAEEIANSELFTRYGKNPDQPYDPSARLERRKATLAEFPEEIKAAQDWAAKKAADMGLRDEFHAPLVGDGGKLL